MQIINRGQTTRHRFQQGREQVLFLVGMVVDRGLIEVAHHCLGRLLCLRVDPLVGHMRHQAAQRVALALDAVVAGGQHLQRCLEAGAGAEVSGQGH